MKIKIFGALLVLIVSNPVFSSKKYCGIAFSYDNFQFTKTPNYHGECFNFSGYGLFKIFQYGGYGECSFTKNCALAKGGALLGLGHTFSNSFHITLSGKFGLGGGKIFNSGASYQLGAETNVVFLRKYGIGMYVSYEKIKNLLEMTSLEKNGADNIMIGIRYIFKTRKNDNSNGFSSPSSYSLDTTHPKNM